MYGYKMVTITISVAPNEQSHVTSHAYDLPVSEEAEYLPGVDLYHFAVTDETLTQLTIETPAGSKEAWYTVHPDDVVAEPSPVEMTLVRSEESAPFEYAYTQEALHKALTHYADQIPHWLNEMPRSTPFTILATSDAKASTRPGSSMHGSLVSFCQRDT